MLFQALYSWIKHKILPPSILFKNRLFLERNSQQHRIFSSLGTTFRSSKWSLFSQTNIKKKFRFNLKFFFYFFLVIIFLFLFYISLYQIFSTYNNLSFLFWVNTDVFDYYLTFCIWLLYSSSSFLIANIYSYLFFNSFTYDNCRTKRNVGNKANFFNSKKNYLYKTSTKSEIDSFFSLNKNDLNWLLYNWVNNAKNDKLKLVQIEKLFTFTLPNSWWNNYFNFFTKLYKIVYFNQLLSFNIVNLNEFNSQLQNLNKYFLNSFLDYFSFSLNLNKLLIWHSVNNLNKNNYFSIVQADSGFSRIFYNQNKNILLTNSIFTKDKHNLNGINNSFYLTNFNFELLNNLTGNFFEYTFLTNNIKQNLFFGKINRWLYRYSNLNRKIFKNIFKITNTKRLVNTSFLNETLFNRNLWNTAYFTKNANFNFENVILSQNNPFWAYTNFLTQNSTNFSFINKNNNLNNFNFFENSYFWILKSFFFSNNSLVNDFFSIFKTNSPKKINNTNYIDYYLINHYFLNNNINDFLNFSHFKNLSIVNKLWNKKNTGTDSNLLLKDLFVSFNNFELINSTNSNLLLLITNNEIFANYLFFYKFLPYNLIANSKMYGIVEIKKNNFYLTNEQSSKKLNSFYYKTFFSNAYLFSFVDLLRLFNFFDK